ncbi:signal peptide protein [Klebsiella aerogenes]|nr:signal peptide protein [Klebsiella aerogenes]
MAIGAAVISLVATQKQINQGSIVDELVRLGQTEGGRVEDEVFVQAARLVRKGT